MVGAPADPHLTLVNVAAVAEPAAGCLSSKMNDLPAVAVGIVNVHAVAVVSVAVNTVPEVIARVAAAPTVPLATMVSVYADIVKEPVYEMTPALSIRSRSVAPAEMITVSVRAADPIAPPTKVLLLPVVLQ